MDPLSVEDVTRTVGYLGLGLVGTTLGALLLPAALQPVQVLTYDLLYATVGPWTATETASIVAVATGGVLAAGLVTIVADAFDRGPVAIGRLLSGLAGAVGVLLVVLVAAAILGLGGLPVTVLVVAALAAGAFVGLRRVGAWPAPALTLGASLPALAFLLVLLGVGLGWGGGYQVVATPTNATAPGDAPDFAAAPAVAEDLFASDHCEGTGATGVCRLELRGYPQEAAAARFLADHGVRCPFLNAPAAADPAGSVVAVHDDRAYSVTCVAYGD